MSRETKLCRRKAVRKTLLVHRGVILVILFMLYVPVVCTEAKKESLQDIYEKAEQLAKTPEGMESAIAKYRSVVDIHRENDKVFLAALRGVLRCYSESGQIEEGARFLVGLSQSMQNLEMMKAWQEIVSEFASKHSDVVKKVVAEMGLSSKPKSKAETARVVPSRKLIDAILQRKDKALREKSLAGLREMLSSESSNADKGSALATLRSALTAKFDRTPFRPLVLALLKSEVAEIRTLALQCLPGLEATASDLDHVIPLVEDPSAEVRRHVGSALIQLGKGDEAKKVIPALMKLLEDEDYKIIERTLRSMWGQYSSPEFDALLIKLSRNPRHRGHAIYHCLSTMRHKSATVCHRLVEELDEPNWNDSGRAAWGLTYGVSEEARSIVEEGLLKALPEEMNAYTRKNEFKALRNVATEKSRPYLKAVIDSQMETDEFQELARKIIEDLDRTQ